VGKDKTGLRRRRPQQKRGDRVCAIDLDFQVLWTDCVQLAAISRSLNPPRARIRPTFININ
jgi:hypothetical protein